MSTASNGHDFSPRGGGYRIFLAPALSLLLFLAAGCAFHSFSSPGALPGVHVVATFPHDPSAFTQGLTVYNGKLYEGTGLYGASSVRQVDLTTGHVDRTHALEGGVFGEGITILDGRLYQLTWQNRLIYVYDAETFAPVGVFPYPGEGWGLTNDGASLILSDGTSFIRFLDPETFETVRSITIHGAGGRVGRLNELEYVRGEIWANIWYEDRIARISPETGAILGWIDLAGLYDQPRRSREAVANGIAFDAAAGRLFLTGKNWPRLYEVDIPAP